MALSDDARRKFNRCIEEMRRGRVSSNDMASDLLERLERCGLCVEEVEEEPDLEALAQVLVAAGYTVAPPAEVV